MWAVSPSKAPWKSCSLSGCELSHLGKKTKILESGQQHNNLQPVTFWEPKGSTASRVKVMGKSKEIQAIYTDTNLILQVCIINTLYYNINMLYTKVWLSACRRQYISTICSKCRQHYNTNWMQFNWQIWFQPLSAGGLECKALWLVECVLKECLALYAVARFKMATSVGMTYFPCVDHVALKGKLSRQQICAKDSTGTGTPLAEVVASDTHPGSHGYFWDFYRSWSHETSWIQ